MWGMAYIASGIMTPEISGDNMILTMVIYCGIGLWIIWTAIARRTHSGRYVMFSLYIIALVEVPSGVSSWAGQMVWNVPYQNSIAQVSMAFADLISAAFAIYLAIFPD